MAKKMKVVAVVKFSDARTGRDYRPGDLVEGWGAARAQHYAKEGLVRVEMPEPDPQLTIEDAPKAAPEEVKEEAEEKETKPGPSEKKPARKPQTKK